MNARFVVTGTDTDVGKTVFAAALAGAIGAAYWKPVQAGVLPATDSETVRRLGGLDGGAVLPERYRLREPLSPHRAAELEGVTIDIDSLDPPTTDRPLVIEGAGGPLVPLNRHTLSADLFARWGIPVILCARTMLGTINHSLLAIEALRARGVPLHGIAFIGAANEDNEATIAAFGHVRRLGRLRHVEPLTPVGLAAAFHEGFHLADFTASA